MTKTPEELFDSIYRKRRVDIENKSINFVPRVIYHYTNLSAFIDIFRTKLLFASRSEFLNDMTEFRYGHRIITEQIESFQKHPKYGRFALKLKDAFGSTTESPFITCFCGNGDLLSQWRGYSHQGQGISIGVNAKILERIDGARINNVVYDREKQVELINEYIEALANSYDEAGIDLDGTAGFGGLVGYTYSMERYCALLKDPGFKEEGEIRLVVPDFNIPAYKYELKFRRRDDLIVPYIELNLSKIWDSSVAEIIIGPGPDREIRKRNIEHFLSLVGVETSVKLSTCQFR